MSDLFDAFDLSDLPARAWFKKRPRRAPALAGFLRVAKNAIIGGQSWPGPRLFWNFVETY
jgi:hypothetical protein